MSEIHRRARVPRVTAGALATAAAIILLFALTAIGGRAAPGNQRRDATATAGTAAQTTRRAPAQGRRADPAATAPAKRFDPPATSPLGRRVHPRLLIVADGAGKVGVPLAAFRERLRSVHRDSFQQYVDVIDAQRDKAPDGKPPGAIITDAIGFALLALTDPRACGFRSAATAADYALLAKAHVLAMIPLLESGKGDTDDLEQINQRRGPASMGAALVYDWTATSGKWTDSERQALANAFIGAFQARMKTQWRAKYVMSEGNPSRMQAGQYGALAMWGDTIPGTAKTGKPFDVEMQRMLDQMHAEWFDYVQPSLEFLLQGRSSWPEGPNYAQEAFNSTTMTAGGLATALDDNLFASSGYLHYWPLWVLGNMRPTPSPDGHPMVMKMNTGGIRDPINFRDYGRNLAATAAMLSDVDPQVSSVSRWLIEHYGLAPQPNQTDIRSFWWLWRFIWGYEHLPPAKTPDALGIPHTLKHGIGTYTMRSGYGAESDTALLLYATETGVNVGGHAAITNSSFTIEKFGALVVQGGNRKSGGVPHVSSQLDFALMGVHKPGEQSVESQSTGNFMGMKYQRSLDGPSACQVENCGIGKVLTDATNRPAYDFVSLDYSRSWDPAKVTRASRDFLYLHPSGGGEYVVVLDRVSTADPSYQKRWHVKVPFDLDVVSGDGWTQTVSAATTPKPPSESRLRGGGSTDATADSDDGDAGDAQPPPTDARAARQQERAARQQQKAAARTKPAADASRPARNASAPADPAGGPPNAGGRRRAQRGNPESRQPVPGGIWEAPGTGTLRMVNRFGPAHGVLFVRSVFPADTIFRKIGGDGYEFLDADFNNYNRDRPPYLTDSAADVMGRYRLEIVTPQPKADDVFLTVMQIGDANQLTAMTPTAPVQVATGRMTGVQIQDPRSPTVLLFSSDPAAGRLSSPVTYTCAASTAQPTHIVFNVEPGHTYYVTTRAANGSQEVTISPASVSGATAVAADKDGVLTFGNPTNSR